MKYTALFLFFVILLTSCATPKTAIRELDYDPSIESTNDTDIVGQPEQPAQEQYDWEEPELIVENDADEEPAQTQEVVEQDAVISQPESPSPSPEPKTESRTAVPSRNIEAAGSLNQEDVVAYIRSQNPVLRNRDIEPVVQAYFKEAAIEGINHDIAIAQMLHATNFFKNRQRTASYNYAGFINTPGWSGSFKTMEEGVRAHIQHLKGYASRSPLSSPKVDPRYDLLEKLGYRGNVKTFDQLYKAWTQNPVNYKKNIEAKLESLYLFSVVKR